MADPTPEEVAAAIATLQAFEHAHETPAIEAEVILPPPSAPAVVAPIVEAPVAVDPYVARSIKDSPNGF